MPVIAVAEVAYGISAIAAGVEGFAAVAAMGAIISGVGTLTGDSDMAQMGGLMGLAGGIGAVANQQSLWPQGSDTAVRPTNVGAEAGADAAASEAAASSWMEGPAVAPVETGAPNVPADVAGAVPGAEGKGLVNVGQEAAKGIADTYQNTFDNGAMKGILDAQADKMAAEAAASSWSEGPAGAAAKSSTSVFDTLRDAAKDLGKWAKDNQILASGMMQVGGKFMEGLFDPTKPAQTAYLQARADSERAQAGLLNQQLTTMQTPLPNAVSSGSRPASPFLGGSRPAYTPPRINVTGAPA